MPYLRSFQPVSSLAARVNAHADSVFDIINLCQEYSARSGHAIITITTRPRDINADRFKLGAIAILFGPYKINVRIALRGI